MHDRGGHRERVAWSGRLVVADRGGERASGHRAIAGRQPRRAAHRAVVGGEPVRRGEREQERTVSRRRHATDVLDRERADHDPIARLVHAVAARVGVREPAQAQLVPLGVGRDDAVALDLDRDAAIRAVRADADARRAIGPIATAAAARAAVVGVASRDGFPPAVAAGPGVGLGPRVRRATFAALAAGPAAAVFAWRAARAPSDDRREQHERRGVGVRDAHDDRSAGPTWCAAGGVASPTAVAAGATIVARAEASRVSPVGAGAAVAAVAAVAAAAATAPPTRGGGSRQRHRWHPHDRPRSARPRRGRPRRAGCTAHRRRPA
jgi:hypothetical protein